MNYDDVDCGGDSESIPLRLRHLLQKMQTDIASVILLSADDLEVSYAYNVQKTLFTF